MVRARTLATMSMHQEDLNDQQMDEGSKPIRA